jgi:hypothetical protein
MEPVRVEAQCEVTRSLGVSSLGGINVGLRTEFLLERAIHIKGASLAPDSGFLSLCVISSTQALAIVMLSAMGHSVRG